MAGYDEMSSVLSEEIPLTLSNRQLVRSDEAETRFESGERQDHDTLVLERAGAAEFHELARSRGDERTYYVDTDDGELAVKVYDRGTDDLSLGNGRLETAIQEAEMLEAARNANIDVAEPIAVNRTDSETYLIKNAGNPENGEVPYWITDVGYLGQNGEFRESDMESHLADAMETSMRQLMELRDQGIVHRSLTPMSHRGNDGFSVYQGFNNIRYLSPEVNFTPTGELKDFEHAERSFGSNQDIGDPVAETVITYLWTAKGAGLDSDTAASIVSAPIDELSVDYDISAPSQMNLREIADSISDFVLQTGQNPARATGIISASPVKEVAHQITEDDDISLGLIDTGNTGLGSQGLNDLGTSQGLTDPTDTPATATGASGGTSQSTSQLSESSTEGYSDLTETDYGIDEYLEENEIEENYLDNEKLLY